MKPNVRKTKNKANACYLVNKNIFINNVFCNVA